MIIYVLNIRTIFDPIDNSIVMKEEKEEGSGGKGKRITFHCLWYDFYLGEGMLLSTNMTKHLKIGKMAFKLSYEFS